jgi:hypothetical protein
MVVLYYYEEIDEHVSVRFCRTGIDAEMEPPRGVF